VVLVAFSLKATSYGDGIGFDWKESPPRELPGPGFDSLHLQISIISCLHAAEIGN